MMFVTIKTDNRLEKAGSENRPCIARAETAKTTNITIEAVHALKMFFA
jgi:hypothetical protein